MVDKNVVQDFLRAIQPQQASTDHTYNATVTRVDDTGIVWVQLDGSDKETPTASTSSEVKMGDTVNVQWRNNKLYVAGNYSNPAAGSVRVNAVEAAAQVANQAATNAVADAGVARQAAEDAQSTADAVHEIADNASQYAARAYGNLATLQSVAETLTWITQHGTMTLTTDVALDPTHVYFVQDAGGDYVVGNVTYAIVTEPKVADLGTYYVLSIDESLNNYVGTHLALTGEGLWLIPEAGGNKVLIATGSGITYTDAGTYILDGSDNVLASFGANGINIGLYADINDTKAVITSGGFDLIKATGKSGHTIVSEKQVAHLGDDYATIGSRAIGSTAGNQSIVIGILCEASGYRSVAEGSGTVASDEAAHAEGANSIASEYASHAEGQSTTASGPEAHAEGNHTLASGYHSHAQNEGTVAQGYRQTAIGSYNIVQGARSELRNTDYAFIIGNGNGIVDDPNERSNALTVDWGGDVCLALDATAASGTDHDLYAAITAIGWQNDVIV